MEKTLLFIPKEIKLQTYLILCSHEYYRTLQVFSERDYWSRLLCSIYGCKVYFQCWDILPNKTVPATESPLIWTVFNTFIAESL